MHGDLSYLQQTLGLRDADVAAINRKIPVLPMLRLKRALNTWNFIANQLAPQQRLISRNVHRPQPGRAPVRSQTESVAKRKKAKWLILRSVIVVAVGVTAFPSLWTSSIEPFPTLRTVVAQVKSDNFFSQGNAKYDKGNYKGAIDNLNEAIRLKPDFALAYNRRGTAKSDLGDKQGAIEDYNKAIQINQNWGDIGLWVAYSNRGK